MDTTSPDPVELFPVRIVKGAKIRREEDKTERDSEHSFDATARRWDERWYFIHEHDWYSTPQDNGSPIIQLSFDFDGCAPSGLGSSEKDG